MNLAAVLLRFTQLRFQPRIARSLDQDTPLGSREQRMSRDAIITLDNRRLQLHVLRGSVWITRDGCPADMVLGAGDVFDQRPGATVLVQALEDAQLLIAGGAMHALNA